MKNTAVCNRRASPTQSKNSTAEVSVAFHLQRKTHQRRRNRRPRRVRTEAPRLRSARGTALPPASRATSPPTPEWRGIHGCKGVGASTGRSYFVPAFVFGTLDAHGVDTFVSLTESRGALFMVCALHRNCHILYSVFSPLPLFCCTLYIFGAVGLGGR